MQNSVQEIVSREADYPSFMQGTVLPALAELRESFAMDAADGIRLYCESFIPADASASVVLVHGFTGSLVKFQEFIFDMTAAGFAVFAAELRGHGRSGRAVENRFLVHTERFEDYADDLELFAAEVQKRLPGLPMYVYAHSLGGGVAALTLERRPELFGRAVLTSPMIAPYTSPLPTKFAARAARGLARRHGAKNCFGAEPKEFHAGSFASAPTSSEARWSWYTERRKEMPELQTYAPTLGWLREATRAPMLLLADGAAEKVKIPVLLCSAGEDHLVDRKAQERFAARAGNCKMVVFPGSRHEIYGADDDTYRSYLDGIVSFFR